MALSCSWAAVVSTESRPRLDSVSSVESDDSWVSFVESEDSSVSTVESGDSSVSTVESGDSSVPSVESEDSSVAPDKSGDSSVARDKSGDSSASDSLPLAKIVLFSREDVITGWKSSVAVGAGLQNMGNTCYMNSVLQALFHIPSFANWLLSRPSCSNSTCTEKKLCLICLLAETLQMTRNKSRNAMKPAGMHKALKFIFKRPVRGEQEDAHEFLRCLIEALEESFLQSVNGTTLDATSKETNPLSQIFGGYLRSQVVCDRCQCKSTTFQHFQEISLDIEKVSDLVPAMKNFFCPEKLEDYNCEKCKTRVTATKKVSIERTPNVLCIQLKRFDYTGSKISTSIACPREINLDDYLSNSATNGETPYKFVSQINHLGWSQYRGHYTAIAEASNGKTYTFNDALVKEIPVSGSSEATPGKMAYVVMYERLK